MLLARVQAGATSLYARPTAVAALAELGNGLERRERERVLETLIDLLRAPHYSVAMAAARGLGVLGAPEAIGALEAFARTRVTQEAAVVERVIDQPAQAGQGRWFGPAEAGRDARRPPAQARGLRVTAAARLDDSWDCDNL